MDYIDEGLYTEYDYEDEEEDLLESDSVCGDDSCPYCTYRGYL